MFDDLRGEGLHGLVVGSSKLHRAALAGDGEELGALLDPGGIVDVGSECVERFDEHSVRGVVLRPLVVGDSTHRNYKDQEKKEDAQDDKLIILLEQKSGKTDTDLGRLGAVWVAVLLPVQFLRLVREGVHGVLDLVESRNGQGIVPVFVWMVDLRQLSVGLLNVLRGGVARDFENSERVKLIDLLVSLRSQDDGCQTKPHHCQDARLDEERAPNSGLLGFRFSCRHGRCFALSICRLSRFLFGSAWEECTLD
mmetsp:Transcript_57012/g.121143  ORF Transcript_57012/g.121143 Transcript_57012/m.121143 type:complete len:252 (-) Transcript_57012:404-1159(-)